MTDTTTKKVIPSKRTEASSSDKRFAHLDNQIQQGGNTFSSIQRKTKEELAKQMETKKEKTNQQQKNIETYWKVLFLNLKDTLDNCKVANNYLFELIKDNIKGNKSYHGMYKIDIVKKDDKGIICRMVWGKDDKDKKIISISNEQIMKQKKQEDNLEEAYTRKKTYYDKDGKKQEKIIPGKKEDFTEEIQYADSVIIDVQNGHVKKINPDDIIDKIRKYIKQDDNTFVRSKKIQTAMKFFNETQEQLSSKYLQEFFKLIRNKNKKRNKEQWWDKKTNNNLYFAELLKRYLNTQKHYVHRENDIDKSSLMFLLDKFGIKLENKINEINHNDIENINSWIFWDVWETTNGIKIIEKVTWKNSKWQEIRETKKIISEHTDASDEAILTNRPSSTTQMIFKIAKELWIINKEQLPQIERFVNFVNTVDSMDYQISSIDYKHNYQTLFGLYRKMSIQNVFDYFKDPEHNGFEKLPKWYMEKTKTITKDGKISNKSLQEISESHKERIEKNIDNFEKIKKAGKELSYGNTKFIVDIEKKPEDQIQDGPQTAGYHGYGFFNIKSERGNIYIYSPKKFPAMIEWFSTDGHFLIINNPTSEDLERLLEKFNTTDTSLKTDIINHLKSIQKKNEKPLNNQDISSRCKILPKLTKKELKIGKTYTGVINSDIQNKLAYVTLDQEETIKWRIKVEDKNELKKYKKWDIIKVKIEEIAQEEWKLLTLSLVTTK